MRVDPAPNKGCTAVTKFDSIGGSHVVGLLYRKTVVCGLPDRQRYIDKFKTLRVDKFLYVIPRSEWTDDSAVVQNRVENMTIKSY